MPTYEYTCSHCAHKEEIWCKVSERNQQVCRECGETTNQVVRTPAQPHWTSLACSSSASPEALRKFDSMRRQQRQKEEKCKLEHGDYGKAPGS